MQLPSNTALHVHHLVQSLVDFNLHHLVLSCAVLHMQYGSTHYFAVPDKHTLDSPQRLPTQSSKRVTPAENMSAE